MVQSFREVFEQLAMTVNRVHADGAVDPTDGHARFAVYDQAVPLTEIRDPLLVCLALDPDQVMAHSVRLSLLVRSDATERAVIIDRAPDAGRGLLEQRAADLATLEAIEGQEPDDAAIQRLLQGSDWLQRAVIGRDVSSRVFRALADAGRTRRVRAAASKRLESAER